MLLDEPSRGMHPRELGALVAALADLRAQGNTIIVVEHDLQIIQAADHIIDLGPGAGVHGGRVIASGSPNQVARCDTPTGKWLRGSNLGRQTFTPSSERSVAARNRRKPQNWLVIKGALENNLRGETIRIPLGVLTSVCGVSGSGKSTLLIDTLGRALSPKTHTTSFAHEPLQPGVHQAIEGAPGRTILVDQARKGINSPASF